jgi:hypothetical protein
MAKCVALSGLKGEVWSPADGAVAVLVVEGEDGLELLLVDVQRVEHPVGLSITISPYPSL